MNFQYWVKRGGRLFAAEADDIYISFLPTNDGKPFVGTVGSSCGGFEQLNDAIFWCAVVGTGREMMQGEGAYDSEAQGQRDPGDIAYLEHRGLTG